MSKEDEMGESKAVHFNLYRPDVPGLFKPEKNARAQIQVVTCSRSEACQLLARGECMCRTGLWGKDCVYGSLARIAGPMPRAAKYREWCEDQKERHQGVPFLGAPKKLGVVGEYVWLPYPHLDLMEDDRIKRGCFVEISAFTVDAVVRIAKFRPQSMFGGEIMSYQKEVPPLLLKHLSEVMPDLFRSVMEADEWCRARYSEFTNIGRKAILQTLLPNVGTLKDIHGGVWTWDGEHVVSENSCMSFGLCGFARVALTPKPRQVVVVTNEGQVGDQTEFVE